MISREKLLEVLAYWRTRITARDVAKLLGAERSHVQRAVMQPFRDKFPDLRKENRRGLLPEGLTLDEPVIADQDIRSVFHLLSAVRDFGKDDFATRGPYGSNTLLGFPIEEVRVPDTGEHASLQRVVAAAGLGLAVVGDYAFDQDGVLRTRFTPKIMIQTPSKILFRGYMEKDTGEGWNAMGYLNIVPSRFFGIEDMVDAVAPHEEDHDWGRSVTMKYRLNPALPAKARQIIALDHGLEVNSEGDYTATIFTTAALQNLYRDEIYVEMWGSPPIPIWLNLS